MSWIWPTITGLRGWSAARDLPLRTWQGKYCAQTMGRHPESFNSYMYSLLLTKISDNEKRQHPKIWLPVSEPATSRRVQSVLSSKTCLTGLTYIPETTTVNAWTESIISSILGAFRLLLVKIKSWIQKKRANYFNARSPPFPLYLPLAPSSLGPCTLASTSRAIATVALARTLPMSQTTTSMAIARKKKRIEDMEGKGDKEEEKENENENENENELSCDNDTDHLELSNSRK